MTNKRISKRKMQQLEQEREWAERQKKEDEIMSGMPSMVFDDINGRISAVPIEERKDVLDGIEDGGGYSCFREIIEDNSMYVTFIEPPLVGLELDKIERDNPNMEFHINNTRSCVMCVPWFYRDEVYCRYLFWFNVTDDIKQILLLKGCEPVNFREYTR